MMRNNLELFRLISSIHASKCNETSDFNVALQSFNICTQLKQDIMNNNEISEIQSRIETWRNEEPVV